MQSLPRVETEDLASSVRDATEDTVALAEVEGVADIVDESVGPIAELTPAQRRELAVDVALLVGAYITVVASLVRRDYGNLAGALLVYAAILMHIYWRLIGKLD
jgi:hypothetical protein